MLPMLPVLVHKLRLELRTAHSARARGTQALLLLLAF
jgi:hypothetical protein